MGDDCSDGMVIRRWTAIDRREDLLAAVNEIFFDSTATKSFADKAERDAFRHRWLGRYLEHYPEWAYLALAPNGEVAGYLLGSVDDPARTPLFSDIAYFADFASLTADYPAQLHVNLASGRRGRGLGARLVETFCRDAARAGAPGVHVVTARGMRNVRFYEALGFKETGALNSNGRELVFLARRLAK